MRRMIPENQQEVLKKLSEKTQFLQNVTINGNVSGYSLAIDSDGLSYFTISGMVTTETETEEYISITGIPNGLVSAERYPATNELGASEYVTALKVTENTWRILFNESSEDRIIYFSVMLSQVLLDF